jgi:hypothetical protein
VGAQILRADMQIIEPMSLLLSGRKGSTRLSTEFVDNLGTNLGDQSGGG